MDEFCEEEIVLDSVIQILYYLKYQPMTYISYHKFSEVDT